MCIKQFSRITAFLLVVALRSVRWRPTIKMHKLVVGFELVIYGKVGWHRYLHSSYVDSILTNTNPCVSVWVIICGHLSLQYTICPLFFVFCFFTAQTLETPVICSPCRPAPSTLWCTMKLKLIQDIWVSQLHTHCTYTPIFLLLSLWEH